MIFHHRIDGNSRGIYLFFKGIKKPQIIVAFSYVAPQTGLEPVTHGLTVHRSTN